MSWAEHIVSQLKNTAKCCSTLLYISSAVVKTDSQRILEAVTSPKVTHWIIWLVIKHSSNTTYSIITQGPLMFSSRLAHIL